MSEDEAAGEGWRAPAGFVVAPAVFAALWWAPLDLPIPAHRLAAILGGVVVLWITEAIPMAITAFLGVALCVVSGIAPANEAFAPFADPLIFVFVGTFLLAQAIFHHHLDRRFAFAMLALPGVGGAARRVFVVYALIGAAISMWISNTATVAMMLPIGLSLLHVLDDGGPAGRGYARVLLLVTAFAPSLGGLGTPVGTPPNLIGIGFLRRETGLDLPFFTWMALGVPVVVVLLGATLASMWREAGGAGAEPGVLLARIHDERAALGPWTRGERNAFGAFAVTVALWVAPGIAALALGQEHPLYRGWVAVLPEGVVALLGATLLFVLPVDWRRRQFTLPWSEAVRIEWWIVFLYGGGIALGTMAFKTGLADAMGRGLTGLLGVRSGFALLAVSTVLATVLSETTSNTASANMVVPVVIAFARSAGIDPTLPAIGATMGASLGFMLPVSTPCNAIVYGTGRIPLPAMMRYGIILDLVGVVAIVAVVALLGPVVLPAVVP